MQQAAQQVMLPRQQAQPTLVSDDPRTEAAASPARVIRSFMFSIFDEFTRFYPGIYRPRKTLTFT